MRLIVTLVMTVVLLGWTSALSIYKITLEIEETKIIYINGYSSDLHGEDKQDAENGPETQIPRPFPQWISDPDVIQHLY